MLSILAATIFYPLVTGISTATVIAPASPGVTSICLVDEGTDPADPLNRIGCASAGPSETVVISVPVVVGGGHKQFRAYALDSGSFPGTELIGPPSEDLGVAVDLAGAELRVP